MDTPASTSPGSTPTTGTGRPTRSGPARHPLASWLTPGCRPPAGRVRWTLELLAGELMRQIGSADELPSEVAAEAEERNADQSRVIWRFTTADARIKFRHLYPHFKR